MTTGRPSRAHRSRAFSGSASAVRESCPSVTDDRSPASDRTQRRPSAKTARVKKDSWPGRSGSMAEACVGSTAIITSKTSRMAEREGFEPPIRLPVCRISSAVHSTTLPPLRTAQTGLSGVAQYLAAESARDKSAWMLRRTLFFAESSAEAGRNYFLGQRHSALKRVDRNASLRVVMRHGGLCPVVAMTGSGRDPSRQRRRVPSRHLAGALAVASSLLLAFGPAQAAATGGNGPVPASETIFLVEIGLLLLVGRIMGEAAQRIGQPAVMGQLIGGLLLGPSVFGAIWPGAQHALFPDSGAQKSMIDAVSQLGILMLLLLTGMETDLQLVRRVGRAAITVAIAGVAVPFACGFALGEMLPAAILPKPEARLVTAIFIGTALSISSVKIVAMVVREMNFMRRDLGQIIVATAIMEDTVGWVIIAIAFGLAAAGTVDLWSVGRAVIGTAAFMAASLTIGRRIVFNLIRWTNDNFKSEFPVITIILVIMIAMALITQLIGVNTVLGAFVAGILIGESPILTRHIDEQLRGLIVALFMPVFFGLSGLSADLTVLKNPQLALLALGLIAIASVGKFLGAFVGGKLGGLTRAESLALGCGMNARGSTEVIVATIGLSMGVLNRNLFTLIVTMAIVTTLAMPPMLRWALKRLPMRKKERVRLEREELDAKSFVTNLERLLLAADDSANGKFASHLAGVIAGSGGKPTTVVDMSKEVRGNKNGKAEAGKPADKSGETAAAKENGKQSHEAVEHA